MTEAKDILDAFTRTKTPNGLSREDWDMGVWAVLDAIQTDVFFDMPDTLKSAVDGLQAELGENISPSFIADQVSKLYNTQNFDDRIIELRMDSDEFYSLAESYADRWAKEFHRVRETESESSDGRTVPGEASHE